MSEVGALIIKLQAETAQFREDMGKVKQDLADLKPASQEAGEAMGTSMHEARGGLMLTEEIVGVHIPRHLNALIAQIPGVGAVFANMLPIIGVVAAIAIVTELIRKHEEMKDKAAATRAAYVAFAGGAAESLRKLQDELLQAGMKMDELTGDHAAKLQKELQLIDSQTLSKLVSEFDKLADHVDKVFADMRAQESFFQIGSAAKEVQSDLKEFKDSYDLAMQTGNTQAAAAATAKFKNQINDMAVAAAKAKEELHQANQEASSMGDGIKLSEDDSDATKEQSKALEIATQFLKDYTQEKKVIAQINSADKGIAVAKENKEALAEEAAIQKILTQGTLAHDAALHKLAQTQAEIAVAGDKGNQEESIDAKLDKSLQAIQQEHEAAVEAANQILESKKTLYAADLKAAGQNVTKKKELDAQYANDVRAHDDEIAQADADAQKKSVAATATAAAEKQRMAIAAAQATADGTLAIDIKSSQDKEKAALQEAKNQEALHKATWRQTLGAEVQAINEQTAAEVNAYNQRIANLNKFSADYQKKVQELQNKIIETEKKGTAQVTQIEQAAQQKQLINTQQAYDRMYQSIANDVAKSIVENKSLAQSFRQTGEQLIEGMIRNLIMMELTHDREKLINAEGAFDKSFNWASAWGGPIAGAVAGAAAFAAVMSFEVGGKIPGSGPVSIVGHGGETVVTRALTDRVEQAEGKNSNSRGDIHMHNSFAPHIQALDSESMDRVLAKHGSTFQRHITSAVRRMNRG
jgi:hypothetical protein